MTACGTEVDADQARACRLAATGLAQGESLALDRQITLPVTANGLAGVRIEFVNSEPGGRWIECRFTTSGRNVPPDLAEVRTPSGLLSEPRLFVLKRYWLGTSEAAGADPLVAAEMARLPVLPSWLAYGLQQALNALPNAAIYSLLAAAYSLVYGLTGRINLAFGELAAAGGYAALTGAALAGDFRSPLALFAGLALLGVWAAAFHGAAVERLVIWPLRRSTGQQGLVATVGVALFLQEYFRLTQGAQPKWIPEILASPVALARAGPFKVTLTPIAIVIFVAAGVASLALLLALKWTRFGRDWRAASDDPLASALFGVDPKLLSLRTFVIASGLVGLAGASVTIFYGGLGFVYTTTLGLKALIAAIVGGIGSVPGAFLGGIGIALVEALWSAYLPIDDRDFVVDCILVIVLVLRPGGLFGYRDLLPRRV